jgi:hypothetical protein
MLVVASPLLGGEVALVIEAMAPVAAGLAGQARRLRPSWGRRSEREGHTAISFRIHLVIEKIF